MMALLHFLPLVAGTTILIIIIVAMDREAPNLAMW